MNKRKFQENVGKAVRLRPRPWEVRDSGRRIAEADDEWHVERVDDVGVRFVNLRTQAAVSVEWDNIKNWQSPAFLILRCRITIGIPEISYRIEPLLPPQVVQPTPDEVLTQAVRDAMRAMPGWTSPNRNAKSPIDTILADEDRRSDWFAGRWRDADGGACLPDPFTGATNPCVHIPLTSLQEAHRKVVERKRMENFDPLEDWPT